MFAILLMVLRYIFLLLLFLSIFRLVKWMIGDLRQVSSQPYEENRPGWGSEGFYLAGTVEGAKLVVIESSSFGLKPGDTFAVGQETLIGRDSRSDIGIAGSFASARHARIYSREGQYWLEDLGSTNGTFLNGVQVNQPIVLADGDRIRIGEVTFQFVRWGHEVDAGN